MRWDQIGCVRAATLTVVMLLGSVMSVAWAQTGSTRWASGLASLARERAVLWFDDGIADVLLSEATVLLACTVIGGLLLVGVEVFDLWREQRQEKAAWLHNRIATALQHDRLLAHLAVTPFVHLPLWGWSRTTIELRGQVPTLWLRHAVLRAAEREAATSAAVYHILDQITVVPSTKAWAV